MLSGNSAQAVHSAFSKLADSVMTRATNERSVEDVTRELLRVMLKQWLDENLPAMVERMVREEIERVARTGPVTQPSASKSVVNSLLIANLHPN